MDEAARLALKLKPLDWLLLAVSIYLFVRGWIRGLTLSLFIVAGGTVGLWIALKYTPEIAAFLKAQGKITTIIAIFASIVIIFIALGSWLGWSIRRLIHKASMGFIDRLAGTLLHLAILFLLLGLAIKKLADFNQEWLDLLRQNSILVSWIIKLQNSYSPAILSL